MLPPAAWSLPQSLPQISGHASLVLNHDAAYRETALSTSMACSDLLPLRLLLQFLLFIYGEVLPLLQEQLCELLAPSLP